MREDMRAEKRGKKNTGRHLKDQVLLRQEDTLKKEKKQSPLTHILLLIHIHDDGFVLT